MKPGTHVWLMAGGMACMMGTGAFAQDAAPAAPSADTARGQMGTPAIGDIVVTARKRSESLKDVPASILAISQAQITNLNAKTLSDLNGVTPNVHVFPDGTLSIRGIASSARNAGFEAGAAVYIDGVYQGRPIGNNQDLVDMARVEILRGPQGTLYGKNTTAGAFSLTTVRPGDTWTGYGEVQYGNFNDLRFAGYVAGPVVTDLVGVKLSGFRRTSDGYELNEANGQHYGNEDTYGVRGEVRLTPAHIDIALRGDYTKDNGTLLTPEPVSAPALLASVLGSSLTTRDTVNMDAATYNRRDGGGVSLTADVDLGSNYTLTTISAYRALRYALSTDDDFTPLDIISNAWVDKSRQFSQEVRLASPSTGFFTWIVGAYYFHQTLDSNRPITLGIYSGYPGTGKDYVVTKTDSIAGFANGDVHFNDKLTLNLGLRYTSEHKTLNFNQVSYPGNPYPTLSERDAFTDHDLSPTAALSYKVSRELTVYAKYSKGFKSGGWNPDITLTPNIGFKPEHVDNYEIGLRTRTANGRLSFNLTGYYMDYDNLQVSQFLGPLVGNRITNAGKARLKGIEAELNAQLTRSLTLSAGGAYSNSRYRDFDSGFADPANPGQDINYAGQRFTFTPTITGFASLDLKAPLSADLDLIAHGDVRYQSKEYFDDARTVAPGIGAYAQGGYALVNARLGVALKSGLEIIAFVDNLTDKRALQNRQSDTFGLSEVLDTYLPPRMFGGRVSFKF
jgi:iron complex outermembrane receptor protein